jgi:hypothetical protein
VESCVMSLTVPPATHAARYKSKRHVLLLLLVQSRRGAMAAMTTT